MHYQAEPDREPKLMRCTRAALFELLVDLRPDSPTFRRWFKIELRASGRRATLFAPVGLAHAFQTLEDSSKPHYPMGTAYVPEAARCALGGPGVRHRVADAAARASRVVSERDTGYPESEPWARCS